MTLRRKVIQRLILANILPVLLLTLWIYHEASTRMVKDTEVALHLQLGDTVKDFKNQLSSGRRDAQLLTESDFIKQYLLIPDDDIKSQMFYLTVANQLMQYLNANEYYSEIRVITPDGNEEVRITNGLVRNHEDTIGVTLLESILNSQNQVSLHWDYHEDFAEPSLIISAALMMTGNKEQATAFVLITITESTIQEHLDRRSAQNDGFFVVNSKNNHVIWPSKAIDPKVKNDLFINPEILTKDFFILRDDTGEIGEVFAIWPKSQIKSKLTQLLALAVSMSLTAFVITSSIIYLAISRTIITPLEVVKRQLSNIGSSDFSISKEINVVDEIGELSKGLESANSSIIENQQALKSLAYYDELTGLANRHHFFENLSKYMSYCDRHEVNLSLLFMDLDGFKEVNDTLGHEAGDNILHQVAERLKHGVRNEDIVSANPDYDNSDALSRLGGDEFTIILFGIENSEECAIIANRLINSLNDIFVVEEHKFHLGASIGIAHYPQDGKDSTTLLKNADTAMYVAKERGKNTFAFYNESMSEEALLKHQLTNDLRIDLEENRLELHYQPQIDSKSGKVKGVEALIRWPHKTLGMVPPPRLIAIAEETGLILSLGKWVLRQACRDLNEFKKLNIDGFTTSVNVSAAQLLSGRFDIDVQTALTDFHLNGNELILEITETILIQNVQDISDIMKNLTESSVRFSLDDFGTGYSSLASLQQLNIDELKIDRSFINRCTTDDNSSAIVRAILAMAKQLDIEAVAEGVETEEQAKFLAWQNCDILQGFHFSRPLPLRDIKIFIEKFNQSV